MAVFGFIVYMIITLFASFFCLAVWSWPGTEKGEGLFLLGVAGVFWYGAYHFNPFTIGLA